MFNSLNTCLIVQWSISYIFEMWDIKLLKIQLLLELNAYQWNTYCINQSPQVNSPLVILFSGLLVTAFATVCFLNDQSYKIAHIQSLHILHPDSNLCKETLKSKVKRIDVYGVVSLLHPSFCTFPTSLCLFFPSGNYWWTKQRRMTMNKEMSKYPKRPLGCYGIMD